MSPEEILAQLDAGESYLDLSSSSYTDQTSYTIQRLSDGRFELRHRVIFTDGSGSATDPIHRTITRAELDSLVRWLG